MTIFQYQALNEKMFKEYLKEMAGYDKKTTFFGDLSIAERFGKKAVNDTYNNIIKEWIKNLEYITEFCMALNMKAWQMYDNKKMELSQLYSNLYYKCIDAIEKHFEGNNKALEYFYNTIY